MSPTDAGRLVVFRDPQHDVLDVKCVVAWVTRSWRSRMPSWAGTRNPQGLEEAVLAVDGTLRHEPQVDLSKTDSTCFGPVTVPPDAVFALRDNPSESIDLRTYGAIPLDELVGRVVITI